MRVKLWDLEHDIFAGLRSLPKQPYLCAMWVLADELRIVYSDRCIGDDRRLMAMTLDLVRTAAGRVLDDDELARAAELAKVWRVLCDSKQDEVEAGLSGTWLVFSNLALEVVGAVPEFEATNWVTSAVVDAFKVPDPRGFELLDSEEEADEDSPTVRMLRRFESVVRLIKRRVGSHCDPDEIRAALT